MNSDLIQSQKMLIQIKYKKVIKREYFTFFAFSKRYFNKHATPYLVEDSECFSDLLLWVCVLHLPGHHCEELGEIDGTVSISINLRIKLFSTSLFKKSSTLSNNFSILFDTFWQDPYFFLYAIFLKNVLKYFKYSIRSSFETNFIPY